MNLTLQNNQIAYYEENNFHTEIIPSFLFNFDTYFNIYNNQDLSYYQNYKNFNVKNKRFFFEDVKNYNFYKIIISYSHTTNEMYNQLKEIYNEDNIYVVCHLKEEISNFKNIIVLTPLNNFNHIYFLPIHNFNKINNVIKKNNFAIIGRFKDNNRDYNQIINIIKKYSNYQFCFNFFTRNYKSIPNELKNIENTYPNHFQVYDNLNDADLEKMISRTKFIFTCVSKNSCYLNDRLSGMIPLSFNFNIPLVTDYKIKNIYELYNCISYDKNIEEVFLDILNISNDKYNELVDKLYNQKNKIIDENKTKFLNKYK